MKHSILEILLLAQHKTDPKLALHAKRVACYASELAIMMNQEPLSKKLFIAGLVHDCGFISIDLDFSENFFEMASLRNSSQIEKHATESERLIHGLTGDNELCQIIRHHHEKFNGTGYPDQLTGSDIPLAARILAVADTYDSLIAGKLMGEMRITPLDALEKMQHNFKDISLDPEIIHALEKLLEKNPVLMQPDEHNTLNLYTFTFLNPGNLEQGDLINQDGTVLIRQNHLLDAEHLKKVILNFPGHKMLALSPSDPEDADQL
jgi:HD-GYP domain-containing protein (c-di-GMP phosphodiesterase class II)